MYTSNQVNVRTMGNVYPSPSFDGQFTPDLDVQNLLSEHRAFSPAVNFLYFIYKIRNETVFRSDASKIEIKENGEFLFLVEKVETFDFADGNKFMKSLGLTGINEDTSHERIFSSTNSFIRINDCLYVVLYFVQKSYVQSILHSHRELDLVINNAKLSNPELFI